MEIIPAILPKNYEDLKNKIALVKEHVDLVQIDLCDGVFVKSRTWPYLGGGEFDKHFLAILNENEGLPFWEEINFELDLMVRDALDNFDIYMKLGPKRIILHLEAFEDKEALRDFLEGLDPYTKDMVEIGLAINIDTNIEELTSFMNLIDFVQFMGIAHIGYQGEEFDDRVLEKIKSLKEKYNDVKISVDGGIDLGTATLVREAGAERVVSGSAIFNTDDIIGTIEEFKNL